MHESGNWSILAQEDREGRHTQGDMEPEVDGTKVKPRDEERMRDTGTARQGLQWCSLTFKSWSQRG